MYYSHKVKAERHALFSFKLLLLLTVLVVNATTTFSQSDKDWHEIKTLIRNTFPTVEHISVDSLNVYLADATNVFPLILDAREEIEYQVSHLPTAIRISPQEKDFSFLKKENPSRPIVIYCSVGYRSAALAARIQQSGISNIVNLEGSIFAWANAGFPVYRGQEQVEFVHPYDKHWEKLLNPSLRSYTIE